MTRAANDNEPQVGAVIPKRPTCAKATAERFRTLEDLPLFASEPQIATAILGRGKNAEWRGIAKILEGKGFPRIDGLHGGRYVPAIRSFYDDLYGVRPGTRSSPEPDRPAEIGKWDRQRRKSALPG